MERLAFGKIRYEDGDERDNERDSYKNQGDFVRSFPGSACQALEEFQNSTFECPEPIVEEC